MVDSIHSYACLMYIDTSKVYLDSVIQETILDSIFGEYDTVWFGWECDQHFLDSLCFGARTFVNGPGQLARIWLRGKQEGETLVQFSCGMIRHPDHPFGPGMKVTTQDGQIIVLELGIRFGEVNANNTIDLCDVLSLVNYLHKNRPELLLSWFVGDADRNILMGIADVLYLINYLY